MLHLNKCHNVSVVEVVVPNLLLILKFLGFRACACMQ